MNFEGFQGLYQIISQYMVVYKTKGIVINLGCHSRKIIYFCLESILSRCQPNDGYAYDLYDHVSYPGTH